MRNPLKETLEGTHKENTWDFLFIYKKICYL